MCNIKRFYNNELGAACKETVKVKVKVKVKESHNRPGVAQSVPGGLDSHISMIFGT
jgi:hypothetical protein